MRATATERSSLHGSTCWCLWHFGNRLDTKSDMKPDEKIVKNGGRGGSNPACRHRLALIPAPPSEVCQCNESAYPLPCTETTAVFIARYKSNKQRHYRTCKPDANVFSWRVKWSSWKHTHTQTLSIFPSPRELCARRSRLLPVSWLDKRNWLQVFKAIIKT